MGIAKKSILTNLIWRFAERIGAQGIKFIVEIVLARILLPEVYGTVALITIITNILQVFVDSGLGNALIQKKDADNLDFSTVFYANIVFCIFLYIILYWSSPYIAQFYQNSALIPYIRVLGFTVLISGVKNVQQAYVSRNMMFKKFFFSTLGGTIVSGIIGIIMALNGFGIWALVEQQVVNLLLDTIILWITVRWRPEFRFSFSRLKGLFNFGWKLLVSALIDTLDTNLRQLIIGKVYSSADLAQYNRGRQFPFLIVSNVNTSIDSVLLPAMSKEQDDMIRIKAMTRRSIRISTYIMAPLMFGMASVGTALIGLILTDKWLPSVYFMRIMCITFVFYPIHTANLNAIKALGRSDLFLRLEIEKKVVGLIALIATMFISVKAIAISLLFTSLINQAINSHPNKKLLNYGYKEQIKDMLPSLLLSGVMAFMIYPIQWLGFSYLATLIIQIILGVTIYIAGSKIFHLESLEYIIDMLKPYIKM